METKKKDFDAVQWVRKVRHENVEKYGHLPMAEFLLALEKDAAADTEARKREKVPTAAGRK